jgi:hypothetical protein
MVSSPKAGRVGGSDRSRSRPRCNRSSLPRPAAQLVPPVVVPPVAEVPALAGVLVVVPVPVAASEWLSLVALAVTSGALLWLAAAPGILVLAQCLTRTTVPMAAGACPVGRAVCTAPWTRWPDQAGRTARSRHRLAVVSGWAVASSVLRPPFHQPAPAATPGNSRRCSTLALSSAVAVPVTAVVVAVVTVAVALPLVPPAVPPPVAVPVVPVVRPGSH